MFDINGWEFFALLLLALLIFGERLPKVIADGLRMLRNLRRLATTATTDLSRELGTDISIEDLNPKNFVRKHLLSEEDEAALRKPLQGLYEDVKSDAAHLTKVTGGLRDDLSGVSTTSASADAGAPAGASAAAPAGAPAVRPGFDDAT